MILRRGRSGFIRRGYLGHLQACFWVVISGDYHELERTRRLALPSDRQLLAEGAIELVLQFFLYADDGDERIMRSCGSYDAPDFFLRRR